MSGRLAQIGVPGQRVDPLTGDVDARTGRLLTVAELQHALRLAIVGTVAATPADQPSPWAEEHDPAAAEDPFGPVEDTGTTDRGTGCAGNAEEPGTGGTQSAGDRSRGTGKADDITSFSRHLDDSPTPVPVPDWGANPVPVGSSGDRPVPVPTHRPPTPESGAVHRFGVSDLLRLRGRDRDRSAARVLTGCWAGSRRVLFGSLTGGAGRSTTAAAVCAAALDAGVSVLVLDGAGQDPSDVAVRVGAGEATRRDWTWAVDPDAALHFAALHRRADPGAAVVPVIAIGGDRGSVPPADAVTAAAAAAAGSFQLVLVDLPVGAAPVRAAVTAGPPELLVMLCHPDPAEIGDTAEFLRDLDPGLDCARHAVIAVRADRRGLPRAVRRGLAAAADAAAGVVTVAFLPAVTGRRAVVTGPAAAAEGRVLAAAAVLTPGSRSVTVPSKGEPEE